MAVITGGSEGEDCLEARKHIASPNYSELGIGYACAHQLLKNNIKKVFILSVSQDVIDGAKKSIAEDLGQDAASKMKWIQVDLSDWNRTAEVSKQIRDETNRLDILINNSARGIMTYQVTEYGVDRHMAVK